MESRKIFLWLVLLGAAGAIAGILMKFSGKPSLYDASKIVGWGGIAVILIARIFFARRGSQKAPPPKA
jgi:hypothetical protein